MNVAQDSETRLEAEDLALERGERSVAEGVTFSIPSGRVLPLVGANGSGKTSLLRVLAGFAEPTRGSLRMRGANAQAFRERRSRLCHWIAARDPLDSFLSAIETCAWHRGLLADDRDEPLSWSALRRKLDVFGLRRLASRRCAELSEGQRKRLSLTRLVLAARPIWLLDEAWSSLDEQSRRVLDALLDSHLAEGGVAVVCGRDPRSERFLKPLDLGELASHAL